MDINFFEDDVYTISNVSHVGGRIVTFTPQVEYL